MSRQPDAHESYKVAARTLHWTALILALCLLAIVLGVYTWARPVLRARNAPVRPIPSEPRLQSDPPDDLAAVQSLQRMRLDRYQWIDRAHTVARIPIRRAMALTVAAHGGPASPSSTGPRP